MALWPGSAASLDRLQALAGSLAVGALLPFPHCISHFSLLSGGQARGSRILSDSNVDWEQDWVRVARDVEKTDWRPITLMHAGAGFSEAHVPGAIDLLASRSPIVPGYSAVAATTAGTGTVYLRALRDEAEARRLDQLLAPLQTRGGPVATVGGGDTATRRQRRRPRQKARARPRPPAAETAVRRSDDVRARPGR